MLTASYTNLETIVPAIDTDPANVNPGQPPPDLFRDDPYPGGTTITIEGPKYSAGLSKRYVTPPPGLLPTMSRFTFSYQIRPSETASLYSQVHENDFRVVGQSGEVYPGDTQKNNQEGGMWMIPDGKGGWIDTGFRPGLFAEDQWTLVTTIYQIIWGKSIAIVNITDGTQTFAVPPAIGVLTALTLGWEAGLLGCQNQEGLNALGGTYTCSRRNIGIAMQ